MKKLIILALLIISALQFYYIISTYGIDAPLEDWYPAPVADALYHITASDKVTLFEDGSFIIGSRSFTVDGELTIGDDSFTIGGCLPFAICNEEWNE